MRLALAAFTVLLAAAPVVAAGSGDPRLDAFLEACLDGHRDPAVRSGAIAAAGWTAVADDVHPSLGRVLAISREAMAESEEDDGIAGTLAVYGRTASGLALYLVTTELDMPESSEFGIDLLGCYLYDFAADAPLDAVVVTAHFGEQPAEVFDEPGVIQSQTWNVEKIEGVWDVRHIFIPEKSPATTLAGFSGVLLKITSTRES